MSADLVRGRQIITVKDNGNYPFGWQGGLGTLRSGQSEGTLTMQAKTSDGTWQAIDTTNGVISGAGAGNDIGFRLESAPRGGYGGARDPQYRINVSGASTFPFNVDISPSE